jgi:ATP-dependent DNA helicase RecG
LKKTQLCEDGMDKVGDYLDITKLKGIGPKLSDNFRKLGIATIKDALYYFPRDYEDRSNRKPINLLQDGECAALEVKVERVMPAQRTSTGKTLTRVLFKNLTGKIIGVWFNQPYMAHNFKSGEEVFLYGKVVKKMGELQLVDPDYDKDLDNSTQGINPIYSTNKSISQKLLRKTTKQALEYLDSEVNDFLSESLIKVYSILDEKSALRNIHFPSNKEMIASSMERLKFDELLLLQLCLLMAKRDFIDARIAPAIKISYAMKEIKDQLPFELTEAQSRTIREILTDMKKTTPMNRLVQGDVGSGKTIVAFIGLINTAMNGYQAAMMAPTEILAEQHYNAIQAYSKAFDIKAALIKGSTSAKEKREILEGVSSGEIGIVIGTHALIQDKVEFKNLALVVTDEQHRFGVRQRAALINKGSNPHVLVMTATPIPRTLALFIYGDMDISIIDELPPGRKKIDTFFVEPAKKDRIYKFVKKELESGRQAYVVCPLVEESEKIDGEAAVELREYLKYNYFENYNVGLLHGKMPAKEKDAVMEDFKKGEINILVSTTVVEVGVNVPNATIMIIENSERFGLAQLHQLRGRVGRGEQKSYCIMISSVKSKELKERMKIMVDTNDGFKIADKDLELRGSGEFFGFRQHGLPELKMADIVEDIDLVKRTRDLAKELVESNKIYSQENSLLKKEVDKFFEDKIEMVNFN